MKRKFIRVSWMLALAGLVSFSFVGTSCGDDDDDDPKPVTVEKVTVTFDTDGGSAVAAVEVEKGKEVSVAAPTKDGFTFKGWATEKGGTVQSSIKPDKDITLYAVWEKNAATETVKVKFDTDGGSEVAEIEIAKGGTVNVAAPTKENFTFKGWATTKGGEVVADIKADADITLYAVWEAVVVEPKILTVGRNESYSIVASFDGIDFTKITKVAVDDNVIDMTNEDQKKKVNFAADKNEATIAPSPLKVGDHKVTFTFTDAEGTEKTVEQTFAITEAQLPKLLDVTGDTEGALVVKASQKLADGWDNQFWIVLDEANAIKTGDKVVLSMKVRAEKEASIGTQIHKAPGEYIHYVAVGNVNFTTEWTDFTSSEVTVDANQNGGYSIAFNLNDLADANNYYVKDVKLTVNGTEVPTTFAVKDKGTGEIYVPQTGGNTEEPVKELAYETPKTIFWYGQWSGPSVQVGDDWATVTAVFEEKPENVQFCVISDYVVKEQSWGKDYQATWPQIDAATAGFDVAAQLTEMQGREGDQSTKITTVTIQYTAKEATEENPYSAKLKALIVTKKDGSKELVVPTFAWGGKIE